MGKKGRFARLATAWVSEFCDMTEEQKAEVHVARMIREGGDAR
jgi:hypothetical protein